MSATIKKRDYANNLFTLLNYYDKALLVKCDSVGSKQFQKIRRAIRGNSIILLGKNTLIKRNIRVYLDQKGSNAKIWSDTLNYIVGNVGIIFTEGNLLKIHKTILCQKVCASARVGTIAFCDVLVPAGCTGMDPSSTSFFQALNIPTKINKGNVEIISSMTVIKSGNRVGSSEATLLTKLGIKPFLYGLETVKVFEKGSTYNPNILELTNYDLDRSILPVIHNIIAFSIELSIPNTVAVPLFINNGFRNIQAISKSIYYGL